jgi:hypothetical protein
MVKHRMEAEHNGKNWLEIKFLSKSRIWRQAFINAQYFSEGWKDLLLLILVLDITLRVPWCRRLEKTVSSMTVFMTMEFVWHFKFFKILLWKNLKTVEMLLKKELY